MKVVEESGSKSKRSKGTGSKGHKAKILMKFQQCDFWTKKKNLESYIRKIETWEKRDKNCE